MLGLAPAARVRSVRSSDARTVFDHRIARRCATAGGARVAFEGASGRKFASACHPISGEWIEGLGMPVIPIGPEVRRFAASRPMATQPQSPPTSGSGGRWRRRRSRRNSRPSPPPRKGATRSWRPRRCKSRRDPCRKSWESRTSSPPTRRSCSRRRTMRHRRCRPPQDRRRPRRTTTVSFGRGMRHGLTTSSARRSMRIVHAWDWRQSATCEAT